MAKFKVLHGLHCEGKNPNGKSRVYHAGDIVDSASDLNKHNFPGSQKFERVADSMSATITAEEPVLEVKLQEMTIAQLRTFIAENEIEVDQVYSKKSDIIECILVAMDEE